MYVKVTKHAIARYRERLFDLSSSDLDIMKILKEIAIKGRKVRSRLDCSNTCTEIIHQGVSVVVVDDKCQRTVITCLGEDCYRRWIKYQGIPQKLSNRIILEKKLLGKI